jgi:catechol 2,3-dioxygenase-like lactoylglutathione lyase family enzyme
MPDKMQIRHIAIRSEDPDQLGSFYEKTFGLRVVRRNPRGNKSSIYMTDGFVHLAINASKGDQPNGIWSLPSIKGRARPAGMPKIISSIPRATASMSFSTCGRLKGRGL